jgi:hypothetical protein
VPLFDVHCGKCKETSEAVLIDGKERVPCECGGVMSVVWLKAPGMSPDIEAYDCVQLGVRITSRQQRDRILKERGKVLLGPDELRRTDSQLHAESVNHEAESLKFREAMTKAWSDVKNGNVPKVEAKRVPEDAIILNSE